MMKIFEEASISSIVDVLGDISWVVKNNPSMSLNCLNHQAIGGGEGGGETVDWVFEFIENGTSIGFLQFTGYYYSGEGITWNEEIVQVFPKQVMVTEFFK